MKLNMTRVLTVALAGAIIFFAACKKDSKTSNEEVSQDVISQIKALGFNTYDVKKISEGYLVEGDIIVTENDLHNTQQTSPELVIANEEHYRTTNLVTGLPRTLTVSLNTTAAPFPAALTEALKRYNDQGLQLHFTQTTGAADINIITYYERSNTLGSSGFPSGGNPYSQIKMNTYWYSASTNVNYMATIIAHEMGHCVGYRHTDYMSRKYSCGPGPFNNEGSAGVGAIWIPGTPTGPDAGSWMLACIGSGVNRPFTTNDVTALTTVY
jgi:hypothetical protein